MTQIRESKTMLKEEVATGPVTEDEVAEFFSAARARGVAIEDEEDVRAFLFLNPEVAHLLPGMLEEAEHLLPEGSEMLICPDWSGGPADETLLLVLRLPSYEGGVLELTDRLMQYVWDRTDRAIPFSVTSDFVPVA